MMVHPELLHASFGAVPVPCTCARGSICCDFAGCLLLHEAPMVAEAFEVPMSWLLYIAIKRADQPVKSLFTSEVLYMPIVDDWGFTTRLDWRCGSLHV